MSPFNNESALPGEISPLATLFMMSMALLRLGGGSICEPAGRFSFIACNREFTRLSYCFVVCRMPSAISVSAPTVRTERAELPVLAAKVVGVAEQFSLHVGFAGTVRAPFGKSRRQGCVRATGAG